MPTFSAYLPAGRFTGLSRSGQLASNAFHRALMESFGASRRSLPHHHERTPVRMAFFIDPIFPGMRRSERAIIVTAPFLAST